MAVESRAADNPQTTADQTTADQTTADQTTVTAMPKPAEASRKLISTVIERFANAVGRPREARLYLEHWKSDHPEQFALIEISELSNHSEHREYYSALATDLAYLQSVGLTPVVSATNSDLIDQIQAVWNRSTELVIQRCHSPSETMSVIKRPCIPLIVASMLGTTLGTWVTELATRKVVILGPGPLRDRDGSLITILDAPSELDHWLSSVPSGAPDRSRVRLASELFAEVPHLFSVSLTSPLDLLREMFTVRGSGTLIRRGISIERFRSIADLDNDRLITLLEHAFGRSIELDALARPTELILIAGKYQGAAVIEPTKLGPYLSKFAVGPTAQGAGVGRDLWRALSTDLPTLIWRSRHDNPIASWYATEASGLHRDCDWTVYWRNIPTCDIGAAITMAIARPVDFN